MSIGYLLFVGICLGIARHVYTEDLTLKPGETSDAAIDATIRKIRTKCILAQDYYFLRRLAEAQMNSTTATTGGIWRVNSTQLTTVQNACNGILNANCSTVQTELNVDLSTLTMSDLQKPLYSGLVMSLFILNLNSPIPLSKQLQADYWIQHINSAGLENDFVDSANKLENKNECSSPQIDLVFVVDSSSSINLSHFEEIKSFLNDVVIKLDIRPEKTQVSVIRFASTVSTVFGLGTYSTNTAVRNAISNIAYTGWSSATNYALDEARTNVFTNARKSVAAKILVLVTDGRSDNNVKTVEAAQKLKDDGVIIFTIGIANLTDELRAVASEPSCTHFIHLEDYNETDFIVKDIQSESCRAAIRIEKNTQLLNIAIPQTNETEQIFLEVNYTAKSTLATQVLVSVQCGEVTVYASFNNSYPNEADYDYKTSATDDQPRKLFLVRKSKADKLFLTVLSQKRFDLSSSACSNPSYNISINPTAPRTEAACVVKQVNSSYTAKELDSACYDTTPVVGEVSQLITSSIIQNGEKQEQVLDISNITDSSGSKIRVSTRCANVTVYGAFNSYPLEYDHLFEAHATDGNPGEIIEIKNPKADRLILTIVSESRHNLSSPACDHPSYSVSIESIDSTREVVCHRKQDERSCTPAESESKYFQTPTNLTPRTITDGAVTNQLSITAWIFAGLLLAWRLV